jgi:hypothetical protein
MCKKIILKKIILKNIAVGLAPGRLLHVRRHLAWARAFNVSRSEALRDRAGVLLKELEAWGWTTNAVLGVEDFHGELMVRGLLSPNLNR